jgi:hypothetical protein
MGMIFKKLRDPDNQFDHTDVIIRSDSTDLPSILQDFSDFLKGCGFLWQGEITIVDEESEQENERQD